MRTIRHLLLSMLLSSLFISGYAQEDEKYKNIPNRLREQKDLYDAGEYMFPPKPRNNWSVGLKGGFTSVNGDVKIRQPGYTFGFGVRKALGHAFSLRFEGMYGDARGLNYEPTRGYRFKNTNPLYKLYRNENFPAVFYNFRMRYYDMSVQGVINLNNINFYKEQSKINLYAALGGGIDGI